MTGGPNWVRNAAGSVVPDASYPGQQVTSILAAATEALQAMDADRLEELARCCQDLNRRVEAGTRAMLGCELAAKPVEMEMLRRVLMETRANLVVLTRVRWSGLGGRRSGGESGWVAGRKEAGYGDD